MANWFEQLGATFGDFFGTITKGALKSLEGIYDFGAGIVGGVGGLFDQGFQDRVREHIEWDATESLSENIHFDELEKKSWLKDAGPMKDILSGIGGMIPAVAVSIIPGVGPVASTAALGLGAAGNSTEGALQEGADFGASLAYGTGSGIIEGATERLGGFVLGGGKGLIGKKLAGTALGQATSKGLGKVALDFASEAGEEVLSDFVDPLNRYLTGVDKNIGENYKEAVSNLPKTALVGGTVGSVMQGGTAALGTVRNKRNGRGGFKATSADNSVSYINEMVENYGDNAEQNAKYDEAIRMSLEDISSKITKLDEGSRKNYLESIGSLKNAFDENGNVKQNLSINANSEAVSNSIRAISGGVKYAPVSVGETVSQGAKVAKQTAERVIGKGASVVITNEAVPGDAMYNPNDKVIYINNNAELTEDKISKVVALHEVTHITEGTKAYGKLVKTLEDVANDENAPAEVKAIIGSIKGRINKIGVDYAEQMGNLSNDYQKGFLIESELHADLVGELLGNDYFIEKLAVRDENFVKKLYHLIKNKANAKKSELGPDGVRYLNKLANKFAKAIDKRAGGVKLSDLANADEEREENVNGDTSQFDVRFRKRNIPDSELQFVVIEPESINKLLKYPGASVASKVRNYLKTFRGTVLPLGSTDSVYMRREAEGEYTNPAKSIVEDDYNNKLRAASEIYNLLSSATFIEHKEDNGRHPDAVRGWNYYEVMYVIPNEYGKLKAYKGKIQIKLIERGDCFYDITKIEDITNGTAGQTLIKAAGSVYDSSINSIPENSENVNKNSENNLDERYSKSKKNEFTIARETAMRIAEELVKDYDDGTVTAESAERRLKAIGLVTGVNKSTALDILDNQIDEIREFARTEREAYRKASEQKRVADDKEAVAERERIDSLIENNPETQKYRTAEKLREESTDALLNDSNGQLKIETRYEDDIADIEDVERIRKESWQGESVDSSPFMASMKNPSAEVVRLNKYIADNLKLKKYSKKDARAISERIMDLVSEFDIDSPVLVQLKGKTGKTAEMMLQNALNSKNEGERMGPALDIAKYIVQNAVVADVIQSDADVEMAQSILDALKPYLHNINLDHIKGEIKAKYDKNNSPYAMWQRKEGTRGVSADMVAQELEAIGIKIDAINEADIFLAIDQMYRDSKKIIKDSIPSESILGNVLSSQSAHKLEQEIARYILNSYDKYGEATKFSKVAQQYEDRIDHLSMTLRDVSEKNKTTNRILKQIQDIKDSKNGKYANSTQTQVEALNGLKSMLGRINSRSQINRSSTRKILAEFSKWYTPDNPVLQNFTVTKDSENKGFFSPQIKEMADYFTIEKRNKQLTLSELEMIEIILTHFNHIIKSYGKIWRGGKYIEAGDVSVEQQKIMKNAEKYQSWVTRLFLKNSYMRAFMDVEFNMAMWDGHDENGFFQTTYRELCQGLIKQRYDEMMALKELDEFEKKHKHYMKELKKDTTQVNVSFHLNTREGTIKDVKIPKYAAIDLYMVSKTGNVMDTLEETGWYLETDGDYEMQDMHFVTSAQMEALEKQFNDEDRTLIKILEKQYNQNLRMLKYEVDMKRLGFSNIIEGYYYPTHRISALNFDSNDMFVEVDRAANISANKSRVKGAKNAIIVGNVLTKFVRHVNAVTRYANLAIPIENMNRVFNIDTNDNPNKPTSIRTLVESSKMWKGVLPQKGKKDSGYLFELANDVQQVGVKVDVGSRVVSWLRGAYAKFQLGANPKVWFSQLSSYLASYGELSFTSIIRAKPLISSVTESEVDKYCKLAAVRHYEMGVTKAMSVTDKLGKAGEFFGKPIEAVDRGVIKMLFAACQLEAKSKYKLEMGTTENKIKAGEILERVILRTQQNQLVTEQSGAMRSKSEIARAFTMFGADSMKMLSRFLQSISKITTYKNMIKAAKDSGDTSLYERLKAEQRTNYKQLAKYSASLVSVAVYMALIAKFFKWLYNKDDEEDASQWLGAATVENIIGMAPLIRDVSSYFVDGFEVDSFYSETINGVLDASKRTFEMFKDIADGKDVEGEVISGNIKKMLYALGQVVGIPTRNMYNFATGITRRVSEGAGLWIDGIFTEQSDKTLKEKLSSGIERGDNLLISNSIDKLLENRDMGLSDNILKNEISRLIKLDNSKSEGDTASYNPLGSKIPDIVTFDGQEVELSRANKNVFKNGLKSAETDSAKAVKTLMYRKLENESKAYAIRTVYLYHHQASLESITGKRTKLVYFGSIIGINTLSLILAYANKAEGDKYKSRKEKIEEYIKKFGLTKAKISLILRLLGYSDKENDKIVQTLIKAQRTLTTEQKEEFFKLAKVS